MKSLPSVFVFIAAICLTFTSCGRNSTPSDSTEGAKVEKTEALSPLELGEAIADIYVQAIVDLSELIKDLPPTADVKPKIADLKEEYVQQLVAFGKKREFMEDADRSTVDLNIRVGIREVYNQPAYSTYGEAVTHYFDDKELHTLLLDYNILTQYASFDLLKEQAPAEAERLGIE